MPEGSTRWWKAFGVGVAIGAGGIVLAYPAAMLLLRPVTDEMLIGILAAPVVLALLTALVPRWRRSTLPLVVGAVVGVAFLVLVVAGGIMAIAWMLSDPLLPTPS